MDTATKTLLGLIALDLWANIAATVVKPALAREDYSSVLSNIQHDLNSIVEGKCSSRKICYTSKNSRAANSACLFGRLDSGLFPVRFLNVRNGEAHR